MFDKGDHAIRVSLNIDYVKRVVLDYLIRHDFVTRDILPNEVGINFHNLVYDTEVFINDIVTSGQILHLNGVIIRSLLFSYPHYRVFLEELP